MPDGDSTVEKIREKVNKLWDRYPNFMLFFVIFGLGETFHFIYVLLTSNELLIKNLLSYGFNILAVMFGSFLASKVIHIWPKRKPDCDDAQG